MARLVLSLASGRDGLRRCWRRQLRPARPLYQDRSSSVRIQRWLSRRRLLEGERHRDGHGVRLPYRARLSQPGQLPGRRQSSSIRQRAIDAIKTQIADPLGLSVEDAAAGVIELLDRRRCATICASMISGKGYNPRNSSASPTAAPARSIPTATPKGWASRTSIVPAWAAGFSAFGCACADFEYRYDKSRRHQPRPGCRQGAADRGGEGAAGGMGGADEERLEEFRINGYKPGAGAAAARLSDAVLRPAQ